MGLTKLIIKLQRDETNFKKKKQLQDPRQKIKFIKTKKKNPNNRMESVC